MVVSASPAYEPPSFSQLEINENDDGAAGLRPNLKLVFKNDAARGEGLRVCRYIYYYNTYSGDNYAGIHKYADNIYNNYS